jgi:phosphatidylinositol 4-kinase
VSPAFHGFYRAVISTPFPWTFEEWRILFDILNALSSPAIVDRLNRLLADYLESPEHDPELASFMQRLLSHYLTNGRPLSGYFAVCSIIEIQWTILAQALRPKHDDIKGAVGAAKILEAAAANQAWISLVKKPAQDPELSDPSITAALQSTVNSAMQCFTDLLSQIQDMEGEPPMETYAWETLSECLVSSLFRRLSLRLILMYDQQKLASLSCVALEHLDQALFNRIKLLLSEKSPLFENLVQESALQSATILVHKSVPSPSRS